MKHIYIVLSQTGTLVSKALRFYTKDPYNHVSISFDRELTTMYSFGRKHRYNIFNSGLIFENFDHGLYPLYPDANCRIIEVAVSDYKYEMMKNSILSFCENKDEYRYNMLGILTYLLGFRWDRKYHYFCSQFVGHILVEANLWNQLPAFTKPMDFYELPNRNLVYEGKIQEFAGYIGKECY